MADPYGYRTIEGGMRIAYVEKTAEECGFDLETFYTVSLTYLPDAADAALDGQPLQIRVMGGPGNGWAFFDDVQIVKGTEWIESGPTDPNYNSVTLTLAVSDEGNPTPVTDTMTIDVYENPCTAARVGLGLAAVYPADYTKDCSIDLEDLDELVTVWLAGADLQELAEMSRTWLAEYALIEPVPKPVDE